LQDTAGEGLEVLSPHSGILLDRTGSTDEVAEEAAFLACDENSYIAQGAALRLHS